MTTDGYPDTPEDCNQTVAVDLFSVVVLPNKPPSCQVSQTTLDIAIQYIKSANTNQKTYFGCEKCEVRKVKFEESESKSDKETPNKDRTVFNSIQHTMQNSEQTQFNKLE